MDRHESGSRGGAAATGARSLAAALLGATFAAASFAQTQAAQPAAQTMPQVTVTGEREEDGALARRTRVGKTLQDPHEVPQAVTTLTAKLLEEQQVGSLREALRNVSGLTFNRPLKYRSTPSAP